MPRRQLVFLGMMSAVLLGLATYLAVAHRAPAPFASEQLEGLFGLPSDVGLVVGADLAGLRQQQWLVEIVRRASGEVTEAPDYREFVEATGFDYSRDLDRLWVGLSGPSQQPVIAGVAEGYFDRARILDYASQQGATLLIYQEIEIYSMPAHQDAPVGPRRGFTFAFLDDDSIAFASDSERAAMIVDAWLGKAPSVASDVLRHAEFERVTAGRQVWVVNDPARWMPPYLAPTPGQEDSIAVLITKLTFGVSVNGEGIAVVGEASCQEPAQAERLRDNLFVLLQMLRLRLAREPDENAPALVAALDNLSLRQQDVTVEARLSLSSQTLELVLRSPAASAPTR